MNELTWEDLPGPCEEWDIDAKEGTFVESISNNLGDTPSKNHGSVQGVISGLPSVKYFPYLSPPIPHDKGE